MWPIVGFWLISALLASAGSVLAGEPTTHPPVEYDRDVKPVLAKRCYACHGVLKRQAGLRLDTAVSMRKGGDGGPAISPGKADESPIIEAVTGREGWRMPPEGEGAALTVEEVANLRAWIDQGARAPVDEKPQSDPRKHWSYRTPSRPKLPTLDPAATAWARTAIDAFLGAEHRRLGLKSRPQADPATLIRRVSLDLTGLVPTPEEVAAFVADPSDEAYERLVDRLLASPSYGERWGRHWMDVWRYSDWDGYGAQVRESQPHLWRWRDWIVQSLNADRGYDQMVVAMLAADEATPADPQSLRATGYLVRNWYLFNRNVWLDSTVEHTAKAFLGLTLNCAKCHDHKYDPIGQPEYYSFRAFFEPHTVRTDRLPGQPDTTKDGLVRTYDSDPSAATFVFTRGDEKRPVKDRPVPPAIPAILGRDAKLGPIQPVSLPVAAYYPGTNDFLRRETLAQANEALKSAEVAQAEAVRKHDSARDASAKAGARAAVSLNEKAVDTAKARVRAIEAKLAADRARYASPPQQDTPILVAAAAKAELFEELSRADEALQKAEFALSDAEAASASAKPEAATKARELLATARKNRDQARADLKSKQAAIRQPKADYTPISPRYPVTSSGRRLALARWIVDRKNPLTARVAVNHIWMRHFGQPLVPTEFDLGANGKAPTHPALLDWLAVELMESGWRMKPLHRLIVTSAAYRMESTPSGPDDPNLAIDRPNVYYWRMNPRRMEAEAVRDNVLRVAGSLDESLGGPDLDPEAGLTTPRRSIYFRHAKEKRVMFLRLFDSPNVLSCYRRPESVVPQQALALANSPLGFNQARLLAARLARRAGCEPGAGAREAEFVTAAFARVLGRGPTAEERAECERYLKDLSAQLGDRSRLTPFPGGAATAVPPSADPAQRARESLVHVLLNHNDFLTIR